MPAAEFANNRKHRLLLRIGFDMLAVARQAEAIVDIADALSAVPLVAKDVPGPLPDGFAFPLRHGRHDVHHQPTGGGARIERLRHRHQRDVLPFEAIQQSHRSLTLRVSRSSFATMTVFTLPAPPAPAASSCPAD